MPENEIKKKEYDNIMEQIDQEIKNDLRQKILDAHEKYNTYLKARKRPARQKTTS